MSLSSCNVSLLLFLNEKTEEDQHEADWGERTGLSGGPGEDTYAVCPLA